MHSSEFGPYREDRPGMWKFRYLYNVDRDATLVIRADSAAEALDKAAEALLSGEAVYKRSEAAQAFLASL